MLEFYKKMLKKIKNNAKLCLEKHLFSISINKNINSIDEMELKKERIQKPGSKKGREKIMCKAAEVGKIVVNKCLEKNIFINTQKLQKLLVLMQVECIKRSQKPLFKEDIRVWDCGVAIKEVDMEFNAYGEKFNAKLEEFITLLDAEEESVDYVLDKYGSLDAFELNELPDNQKVIQLGVKSEETNTLHISYQILMGAFY